MTRPLLYLSIIGALAACKKDEAKPATKDDSKVVAKADDPPEVDPADEPDVEPTPPTPTPTPTPAPADPVDDPCTRAVTKLYAMAATAGAAPTNDAPTEIAICKEAGWSSELLACIEGADLPTFLDTCSKLAFPAGLEHKIGRVFDALQDNSGADPKVASVDGDFLRYDRKGDCGLLFRIIEPATAAFLMCGATVYAGPLTTSEEIDATMAQVSAASAAGHDLVTDIMNNYPTGRRVKIYGPDGRELP